MGLQVNTDSRESQTDMKKLTWDRLAKMLPLLNARELERRTGLRSRRIADCKDGKSSLSEKELESIRDEINRTLKG